MDGDSGTTLNGQSKADSDVDWDSELTHTDFLGYISRPAF